MANEDKTVRVQKRRQRLDNASKAPPRMPLAQCSATSRSSAQERGRVRDMRGHVTGLLVERSLAEQPCADVLQQVRVDAIRTDR